MIFLWKKKNRKEDRKCGVTGINETSPVIFGDGGDLELRRGGVEEKGRRR